MKKTIMYLLLIFVFCFILSGCNSKSKPRDIELSENEEFYLSVIKEEMLEFKQLVLDQIDDNKLKKDINSVYNAHLNKLNQKETILDMNNIYNAYLNEISNLIPNATGEYDFSTLSTEEQNVILKLLENYAFESNLIGIPLHNEFTMNLNCTTKEAWNSFFGENGSIYQTDVDKYWSSKPFLANANFIKGLNLCLNKELFKEYFESITPGNLVKPNLADFKYNDYNLELARNYFKVAIEELVSEGIYDVSDIIEPIELNIEISSDAWNDYNHYEEIYNLVKEAFETAFNDNSVTNGKFKLNVTSWQSQYFGQIYAQKIYYGQFDLSFGKISGSSIDSHNYMMYELLSSSPEISNGFNMTWSLDTNSIMDGYIVYNGEKFTYDALILLLSSKNEIINGEIVFIEN